MRIALLGLLFGGLFAIDEAGFGASTYHRKFFGVANGLHSVAGGRVLMSGSTGFALISREGELLYSVAEDLVSVIVGKGLVRCVTSEGRAFEFDAESGLLKREVSGRGRWVAVVDVAGEATWVGEREVLRADRHLALDGRVLWARAVDGQIELELQENESFCVHQLDASLTLRTQKSCDSTAQGAPAPVSAVGADGCLREGSTELCGERGTLRLRGPWGETQVEATGERPALLATTSDSVFIFTDRATLLAVDLPGGRLRFRREESLGSIVFARLIEAPAGQTSELREYESLLREGQILAAWRLRVTRLINQGRELIEGLRAGRAGAPPALAADKVAVLVTSVGKVHLFDLRTLEFTKSALLAMKVVEATQVSSDRVGVRVSANGRSFSIDAELKVVETADSEPLANRFSTLRCVVDTGKGEVFGEEAGSRVWELKVGPGEQIIETAFAKPQAQSETAFVVEGDRVVYKLDDPNNFLLLSHRAESQTHIVYIVNARNGRVLAHFANEKMSTSPKILADDNGFVLVYVSRDSLSSEFWVIELFRKEVETDFTEILKRFFRNTRTRFEPLDYSLPEPELVILQRKYGFSAPVAQISALRSLAGLASRNLVVLTASSELFSLPRGALSARRIDDAERQRIEKTHASKLKPADLIKSFVSPPYDYRLPIDPKNSLTKTLPITQLSGLQVEPSAFESTCFVLAFGKDFVLTKTSPDKAFDQLPADFDKMQLLLILSLCFLAVTVTSFFRKTREPANKFKTIYG